MEKQFQFNKHTTWCEINNFQGSFIVPKKLYEGNCIEKNRNSEREKNTLKFMRFSKSNVWTTNEDLTEEGKK